MLAAHRFEVLDGQEGVRLKQCRQSLIQCFLFLHLSSLINPHRIHPATSLSDYLRRIAVPNYSVVVAAVFLVQLMPSHLDGFQLTFARSARLIAKLIEIDHPLTNIGEPRLERVEPWMILGQNLGNLFRLVPLEFHYELSLSID